MKLVLLDTKAVASDDISMDCFKKYGEVDIYDRTPDNLVAERIGDAEIAFTNKTWISNQVINSCKNLRYIGIFATGYNVIEDISYAAEKGIVICNIPDYSTQAVAQHVFAHILEFYNKIAEHNRAVHNGQWETCPDFSFYYPTFELMGKTIGIIGFGNIGRQVAKVAQAFHMNVLVHSRTKKPELENDQLHFTDLNNLLEKSDIVTVHCPLTPQTEQLLNAERIGRMKSSALLINTARGPIIDEQALADALNQGKIAGAGVDVVSKEPILPSNPLLKAKNCQITPHIAWAGFETRERLMKIALDNLEAYLAGSPKNKIN